MEKRNDENEDSKEDDDFEDTIKMDEKREALITEN